MLKSRIKQGKIYTSICGDVRLRGYADQLVAKHEALGYEARREKDEMRAHNHFQCADHYKKIARGELND